MLNACRADVVEDCLRKADPAARALYSKFEASFKEMETATGRDDSIFCPQTGRVTINLKDAFEGKKGEGDTWFHELGHNIDHLCAKGSGCHSAEWRSGAFPKELRNEADTYIDATKAAMGDTVAQMVEAGDADGLRDIGLLGFADWVTIKYRGGDLAEAVKKPTKATAKKLVAREISALTDREKHAVSDMFDGATRGTCKDGWGHARSYWIDGEDEALATEAFAEMFAADIASPAALGKIKEYFPKSYALYREILRSLT